MARFARVVVPGLPHHITQRGNRRQQTFFCDEGYACYLELMAQLFRVEQVEVWACCLMPDHVHLIAVPRSADGLRRAIGEAHRRCTRMVNFRERWRGHLWRRTKVPGQTFVAKPSGSGVPTPARNCGSNWPQPPGGSRSIT